LVVNDIDAHVDAFVADEYGRTCDQLDHLMLVLAAERAIQDLLRRWAWRPGSRTGIGRHADPGGKNIPVVAAESFGDQLQGLAVGDDECLGLQGIAQGVRHSLRVAEIAHESTS
jgi:hypothetical protein